MKTGMDALTPPIREQPQAQWLLTFADLISLLVVFFVLLFSMKEIDRDRWDDLTGSFQGVFAPRDAVVWQRPDGFNNAEKSKHVGNDQLTYLESLLTRRLGGDDVWKPILTGTLVGNDMHYRLPKGWLEGDAAMASISTAAMERLAREIRNWDNTVSLRFIGPADATILTGISSLHQTAIAQGAGQVITRTEWQPQGATEGFWLVIHGGGQ